MSRLNVEQADRCAAQLLAHHRRPRIAVLLGSGWGPLAQRVADPLRLPYGALPGFPDTGVAGHAGEVVLGRIGAHEVAVLCGRRHAYEGGDPAAMKGAIAALARNKAELRHRVATELTLKYAPDLRFRPDETFDRLDETRRLFSDPKVKQDLSAPETDAEDE